MINVLEAAAGSRERENQSPRHEDARESTGHRRLLKAAWAGPIAAVRRSICACHGMGPQRRTNKSPGDRHAYAVGELGYTVANLQARELLDRIQLGDAWVSRW